MDEELPDDRNLEYDEDTLELTLPSGAKVGHRSLVRYYKQRFGTQRALVLTHNTKAVSRVLKQYKALGWGGDAGSCSALQRQRDMQFVQRMKSRWMLKMGMSNNANRSTSEPKSCSKGDPSGTHQDCHHPADVLILRPDTGLEVLH
ncbi:hypothetical protein OJAV_G00154850 [Oryzias javanicus]|uniref:Uncharacterized protein n=1 Tax=Oryzias javanicus TaxID=123683 RepID=A0A3S2U3W3_ORYJA|nr:hypothetical protein OJAV_G00154850 [Oryzias javanicus]